MNRDYKSLVKEIDEMLAIREIDKFLDKIEKKKNKEKEERKVEPKKSKVLPCQVAIYENTKEEIFELPEKPKREIFELYAEPRTEKYKRKTGIDWNVLCNYFLNNYVLCILKVMVCKNLVKIMKSGRGIKKLVFHGRDMMPIGLVNVEEF